MKYIATLIVCAVLIAATYGYAYYKGVNESVLLLSVNHAGTSIATIQYIKNGETEKAIDFNKSNAEASLAAIEDIETIEKKAFAWPKRFLEYRDSFFVNSKNIQDFKAKLKPSFEKATSSEQRSLTK